MGQLLLYCGHMVQVEHNRTVQQGNICGCCSERRITVGQLLLYCGHMVQVEHNRTVQQGNICGCCSETGG